MCTNAFTSKPRIQQSDEDKTHELCQKTKNKWYIQFPSQIRNPKNQNQSQQVKQTMYLSPNKLLQVVYQMLQNSRPLLRLFQ